MLSEQIQGHSKSKNRQGRFWMTLHSRLENNIVNFLVGCRALRGSTAIVGNLRQENLEDLLYVKETDLSNKICYRPSADPL
jgi:hypothetical protein